MEVGLFFLKNIKICAFDEQVLPAEWFRQGFSKKYKN